MRVETSFIWTSLRSSHSRTVKLLGFDFEPGKTPEDLKELERWEEEAAQQLRTAKYIRPPDTPDERHRADYDWDEMDWDPSRDAPGPVDVVNTWTPADWAGFGESVERKLKQALETRRRYSPEEIDDMKRLDARHQKEMENSKVASNQLKKEPDGQ